MLFEYQNIHMYATLVYLYLTLTFYILQLTHILKIHVKIKRHPIWHQNFDVKISFLSLKLEFVFFSSFLVLLEEWSCSFTANMPKRNLNTYFTWEPKNSTSSPIKTQLWKFKTFYVKVLKQISRSQSHTLLYASWNIRV